MQKDKQHEQLDLLFPIVPLDPNMPDTPVDWLIEGLWQRGKINAMAGYEKSGKSRLLGWLLCGLYCPSVLGLHVVGPPPRLLYLLGEETKEVVNQRIVQYSRLMGSTFPQIDVMEASSLGLEQISRRSWLLNRLKGYDGMVIDPLRRVHDANEDKSSEMAPINNALRYWSNHYGKTIIMLHHTPKIDPEKTDMERMASWFRGSTDIAAILDTGQFVNRLTKDKLQLRRAGRFAPLPNINVYDRTDVGGFAIASE